MSWKRIRVFAAIAAPAALCIGIAVTGAGAMAGFGADISSSHNVAGTGTRTLTAKDSSTATQCTTVPDPATPTLVPSPDAISCIGSITSSTVPSSGSASNTVSLTASGSVTPASVNLSAQSCGPVSLSNAANAANPLIPRNNVGYLADGPLAKLSGSSAITLDGNKSVAVSALPETAPQSLTIAMWFKTSKVSSGLIEFASEAGNAASAAGISRSFHLSSGGQIVLYNNANGPQTVGSISAYNNNVWHFGVVTIDARDPTTTYFSISVDDLAVRQNAYPTSSIGSAYSGYWRIGQSYYAGAGAIIGSLSNVAIWPSVLTRAQTLALYAAGSQSNYAALVNSTATPSHYWPLADTGLNSFTGPFAVLGASSPCADVQLTAETAGHCITPYSVGACSGFSASSTLASLVNAPLVMDTPTFAAPQQLTLRVQRKTSFNSDYEVGMQLVFPVVVGEVSFTRNFVWSTNRLKL